MPINLRSEADSGLPDSCGQSSRAIKKVVVVGPSGSGKTTLARRLASAIGAEYVELDAFYHLAGWTRATDEDFTAAVHKAIDCDRWVVDGNYRMRQRAWDAADTIIWLDFPMVLALWQVGRRTFRRFWKKEVLWNGNRESLWKHFLPWDESLFWWILKTHRRRRREYAALIEDPRYRGKMQRFRNHAEADAFVSRIAPPSKP